MADSGMQLRQGIIMVVLATFLDGGGGGAKFSNVREGVEGRLRQPHHAITHS